MKKKIFRNMLSITLIAVLLCSALILGVIYQFLSNRTWQALENEASYLLAALNRYEEDEEYLRQIPATGETPRLTFIDVDGTVLYDSQSDAKNMENHLDRPEVQQAMEEGWGRSMRSSKTIEENTFYYAVQMEDGRILRLGSTQRNLFGLLFGMTGMILIAIALTLAVAAFLAGRMTKSIVQPINDLNLEDPENSKVYDELAPLLLRLSRQNDQIGRSLRELSRRQQEFNAIIDNMSEGLVVLNTRSAIVLLNNSAKAVFHVGGDCVGKNILALSRSLSLQHAVQRAGEGKPSEATMEMDGRVYQLLANPVRSPGETVTGVVLLVLDITERSNAEKMRREFTANVSHELKTPLTSISGYAEIMKNGLAKKEDMQEFSSRIYEESARLITLIEDILELSQLDEGSTFSDKEPVELLGLCRQVYQRLVPQAAQRGISFLIYGQPQEINGVRQILEEMVYNLFDNAIKYNKEGGKVEVTVKKEDGGAVLCVEDTGIGIPPEHQDKVFERFYRVDKSHSKQTGGTGLGLSIVKHGALFHDARVSLESQEGKGTKITIRFPQE